MPKDIQTVGELIELLLDNFDLTDHLFMPYDEQETGYHEYMIAVLKSRGSCAITAKWMVPKETSYFHAEYLDGFSEVKPRE